MPKQTYGRGVAETWIKEAIVSGGITSADTYYDWLRGYDQTVPRAAVREVWREYGEATHYIDVISRMDPGRYIPRAWYADSNSEYIDRYGTRVAITEQDPITGAATTQTYFYKSTKAPTRGEIETWGADLTAGSSPPIYGGVVNVQIEAMYHRAGTRW